MLKLLIISFVCIAFTQKVSPRQEQQTYLFSNNCKNTLLNNILIKATNNNNLNYNFGYVLRLIEQHLPQYKEGQIYKCYDVLMIRKFKNKLI
jgi:hypothetical protein